MTLKAQDVMTKDVTTVALSDSVEKLVHIFRVSHFTGIPVVDAEGRCVGLVSETDILRALAYTLSPPGSGEFSTKFKGRERMATSRLLDAANKAQLEVGAAVVMRELLTRQVQELMTPVVHSCNPDDELQAVCETMAWKEIHRVIVCDADGKVVGLISALDLARRFGEHLKAGK